MADHQESRDMYIYDLPYVERKELCNILDIDNKWRDLGGRFMKYGHNDLERFGRAACCEKSPTDRMLQEWGQQNNTILELFFFLYQMRHFQAMSAIKTCVPEEYHKLFDTKKRFEKEGFGRNSPPRGGGGGGGGATAMEVRVQNSGTLAAVAMPHTNGLPEGASALSTRVQRYGAENLNDITSSPRHQLASNKVPEALLAPSHGHQPSTKPKPVNHAEYNGGLHPNPSTKIANNKLNGKLTEMSCEDNNQNVTVSSKSLKQPYDPTLDYIRKAEEKQAKFLAEEAARRAENMTGAPAHPVQPSASPHPVQQSAANMLHHPSHSIQERKRRISAASDASRHNVCDIPVIPYKELEEGTACWSKDNILGQGGFGTVYKGIWKNSEVAVKKIIYHGNANVEATQLRISQSLEELKLLLSHPHENILQVYGYSYDSGQLPCLVYQFMPNGSVEDRLQLRKVHGNQPPNSFRLSWRQRFVIAHGIARALQFLHTVKDKPLIHGDVKSANILLGKNFEPKLGDFGLAREGKSQSASLKVSRVHGTMPYLPTDYLRTKKLSVKVDTFSYGIVLFELCTGKRAFDSSRNEDVQYLKDLVKTTDEAALRDQNTGPEPDYYGIFNFLMKVAKCCVVDLAARRPDMAKVFNDLEAFHKNLEERLRFKKIPTGEMCGISTPRQLQMHYDNTGILRPPFPMQMYLKVQPGYHNQHPLHRLPHASSQQASGTSSIPYGLVNEVPESYQVHRTIFSPVPPSGAIGGSPPPPYNEAIASPSAGPVNPMIPKFSQLGIKSHSQHSNGENTYSNSLSSSNTISGGHSIPLNRTSQVSATASAAEPSNNFHYIPSVVPQNPGNNSCLPLLSALGPPTGANKKLFDDDD